MEEAANKRQPRYVLDGDNCLTRIPAIAMQETSNGSKARYLQCNQPGDITEVGLRTTSSPITTYLVSVTLTMSREIGATHQCMVALALSQTVNLLAIRVAPSRKRMRIG